MKKMSYYKQKKSEQLFYELCFGDISFEDASFYYKNYYHLENEMAHSFIENNKHIKTLIKIEQRSAKLAKLDKIYGNV